MNFLFHPPPPHDSQSIKTTIEGCLAPSTSSSRRSITCIPSIPGKDCGKLDPFLTYSTCRLRLFENRAQCLFQGGTFFERGRPCRKGVCHCLFDGPLPRPVITVGFRNREVGSSSPVFIGTVPSPIGRKPLFRFSGMVWRKRVLELEGRPSRFTAWDEPSLPFRSQGSETEDFIPGENGEQSASILTEAAMLARELGSRLYFNKLIESFNKLSTKWHGEKRVAELEEWFQLWDFDVTYRERSSSL